MATQTDGVRSRSSSVDSSADSETQQQASKRRKVEFALDQAGVAEASLFVPPAGLKKASSNGVALTEFDLQSLERRLASGCELWAVRLPDGMKLRHLAETTLSIPKDAKAAKQMGNVTIKKEEYDIMQAGTAGDENAPVAIAGEMRNFVALCPTSKGTAYAPVKVPITRRVVLQQKLQTDQPESASTDTTALQEHVHHASSRFLQPGGLNGFFRPSGFDTAPDFSKKAPEPIAASPGIANTPSQPVEASPAKKRKKDKKLQSSATAAEDVRMADVSVATTLLPDQSTSAGKSPDKKAKKPPKSEVLNDAV